MYQIPYRLDKPFIPDMSALHATVIPLPEPLMGRNTPLAILDGAAELALVRLAAHLTLDDGLSRNGRREEGAVELVLLVVLDLATELTGVVCKYFPQVVV